MAELGPVSEAACHQAAMDEIELLLVEPEIFCVVHDEFEIRWNTLTISMLTNISIVHDSRTESVDWDQDQYLAPRSPGVHPLRRRQR